jgi:cytochrome c oxidase assembly factor CtaG
VRRRGRSEAIVAGAVAAAALVTLALPELHERLTGQMAGQAIAVAVAAPLFAAYVPARRHLPAVVGLIAFGAATVAFHLPDFLRYAVVRPWAHGLAMAVLLGAAVLMYRPLLDPDPRVRLPGPLRLPYAMLAVLPAEAMGFAMMSAHRGWQTAAAVMMTGSVAIGLIGLAATWSWLEQELEEATDR